MSIGISYIPKIYHPALSCHPILRAFILLITPIFLVACQPDNEAAAPAARPVRTITIDKRETGAPITFTGRIEAEDEVALAFRICPLSGRPVRAPSTRPAA